MISPLNYHASQARIEEMRRRSEPLQDVQREKTTGRLRGMFVSLSSKSRPAPAWRPSGAPAADKA